MSITDAQLNFFQVFGYLHLPGVLRSEVGWMIEEFEQVLIHGQRTGYDDQGDHIGHGIVPFIDQSARLCTLVDHPLLKPSLVRLLGEDYNYLASDGRPYSGDTNWHPDGGWGPGPLFVKAAFYLDPLTRESGALRVIPGSHRLPDQFAQDTRQAGKSEDRFGMPMSQIPSAALETTPGDVVIFNHNTMHASFGGGGRRRMFTMNLGSKATNPELEICLRSYLRSHLARWSDRCHGPIMRETATPERMRHLAQVIANEGHLVEARKAFLEKAAARRAALEHAAAH